MLRHIVSHSVNLWRTLRRRLAQNAPQAARLLFAFFALHVALQHRLEARAILGREARGLQMRHDDERSVALARLHLVSHSVIRLLARYALVSNDGQFAVDANQVAALRTVRCVLLAVLVVSVHNRVYQFAHPTVTVALLHADDVGVLTHEIVENLRRLSEVGPCLEAIDVVRYHLQRPLRRRRRHVKRRIRAHRTETYHQSAQRYQRPTLAEHQPEHEERHIEHEEHGEKQSDVSHERMSHRVYPIAVAYSQHKKHRDYVERCHDAKYYRFYIFQFQFRSNVLFTFGCLRRRVAASPHA